MVAQIYGDLGYNDLGNYTLGMVYLSFGVVCLFVGNVEQMMRYKWMMFVASFGYNAFLASGFLLAYCAPETDAKTGVVTKNGSGACTNGSVYFFCIFGAFLCGCGASIIWTAQGGYIAAIGERMKSKKGSFFGLFWAINQSSMIIGAALGAVIFEYYDAGTYFMIFTLMGLVAECLFLILPN